jgi:hypothetical protein
LIQGPDYSTVSGILNSTQLDEEHPWAYDTYVAIAGIPMPTDLDNAKAFDLCGVALNFVAAPASITYLALTVTKGVRAKDTVPMPKAPSYCIPVVYLGTS